MSTPPPDPVPGRPTVDDVALLLRARTKDSQGTEVGTFDDDTRPTGDQVEEQIDAAYGLVCTRLPPIDRVPDSLLPALASVVAYRAALRIEKSYFPEQVRSNRSAYDELRQEYLDDLEPLVAHATGSVPGATDYDVQVGPVGSWTSIPRSFIRWWEWDEDLLAPDEPVPVAR